MAGDPWKLRCPEGHTSIDINSSSYQCDACGVTYEGEPFDAAETEFPVEGTARNQWTVERALHRLYQHTGDAETAAYARDIAENARSMGSALARAADKGFVVRENRGQTARWRLTQTGYVRACGDDPDSEMPDPEAVDASKYLADETLRFSKEKLYRLHWGYGLSVAHMHQLSQIDSKAAFRRQFEKFGIPKRPWHEHTGWEPHHGVPPMFEWPQGDDPTVDEDEAEWQDYKPAMDRSPEVADD